MIRFGKEVNGIVESIDLARRCAYSMLYSINAMDNMLSVSQFDELRQHIKALNEHIKDLQMKYGQIITDDALKDEKE